MDAMRSRMAETAARAEVEAAEAALRAEIEAAARAEAEAIAHAEIKAEATARATAEAAKAAAKTEAEVASNTESAATMASDAGPEDELSRLVSGDSLLVRFLPVLREQMILDAATIELMADSDFVDIGLPVGARALGPRVGAIIR